MIFVTVRHRRLKLFAFLIVVAVVVAVVDVVVAVVAVVVAVVDCCCYCCFCCCFTFCRAPHLQLLGEFSLATANVSTVTYVTFTAMPFLIILPQRFSQAVHK